MTPTPPGIPLPKNTPPVAQPPVPPAAPRPAADHPLDEKSKNRIFVYLILAVIVAVEIAGLIIYYQNWARSYLILSPKPKTAAVRIDGIPTNSRIFSLSRGVHDLEISQDGYLTDYQMDNFRPLRIKWKKIALNQMFYVNLINEPKFDEIPTINVFHLTCNQQTGDLIYFKDGIFAAIAKDKIQKSYAAASDLGQIIDLPLPDQTLATVNDIRYSPDSTQAFIYSGNSDQPKISWINLQTKSASTLPDQITDVTWLGNNKGLALQKTDSGLKLSEFTPGQNDFRQVAGAPDGALILAGLNSKNALIIASGKNGSEVYLYSSDQKAVNRTDLPASSLTVLPPNEKYPLVSYSKDKKITTAKLENGQFQALKNAIPGLASVWLDENNLISPNQTKAGADFYQYNLADNSKKLLKNYQQAQSDVSEITACQDTVYFVDQGKIIGFPAK